MPLHEAETAFLRRTAASSGKPLRETTPDQAHGRAAMHAGGITFGHDPLRAAVRGRTPRLIEAAASL